MLGICAVHCIYITDECKPKWKFHAKTLHLLLEWWYYDACILVSLAETCNSLMCNCDDTIFHMLLVFNLLLMELVRGWS